MASEHIERVRVFNGNTFQIDDRHDGVPYEFPAGKTTIIPVEAAQHIFGFPGEEADMQRHISRRFGWNRAEHMNPDPAKGQKSWQELTDNIKLTVEHYDVVRRPRQPNEAIPAEEASDAPDMLGLNIDPPAPRRSSVGKRRGPRKRVLAPRRLRPAPAEAIAEPEPDSL